MRQRLQGADLVDDIGRQVLGRRVDEATAESSQVAIAHLRADPHPPLRGRTARPRQRCGVPGVEAARHVGAGDHVEHRVVVAEQPHPEAFAQIRVEVYFPWRGCSHECQPRPVQARPSRSPRRIRSADGRASSGRSPTAGGGKSGTGPRHRMATGSAPSGADASSARSLAEPEPQTKTPPEAAGRRLSFPPLAARLAASVA